MAELRTQFRGLWTEPYPGRTPSGAADLALNVTIDDGDLAKREGFAKYEADVNGSANAVRNIFVVPLGNGDVYVICKCADGKLWRRKAYATAASSFSELTTEWTHNSTDRGWGFTWADRWHYFDRIGGSRWNPDARAKAYRAGMRRPSVGPTLSAAAGGEKQGRYHVHIAYRKEATRETGVISAPQTGGSYPLACSIVTDTGGITISNWSSIQAADTQYEWDQIVVFCTKGDTEYDARGSGVELFSYQCYEEAIKYKTQSAVGLNKHDRILTTCPMNRNAGGEPPGAQIGCYDGRRAIYGGIYVGANASGSTNDAGATNNDLTFTAVEPGLAGNSITVVYDDTDGVTAGSETVAVSGTTITVQVDIVGGAGNRSTAAQVETALDASTDASALITVADKAGNVGTGEITETTTTSLTGGTTGGTTSVASRIDFSLENWPTMVPAEEIYIIGGDARALRPRPWIGSLNTGIPGNINTLAAGGGRRCAFTPTATYELVGGSDGRLWPHLVYGSSGAIAEAAAVGCELGVFALGFRRLLWLGPDGITDLAEDRIDETLDEIPVAQRTDAVLGWYGHKKQLWCAVTKSGATVAQRIIVYDFNEREFVIFEPACLASDESITAMCELAVPNAEPTMLVGTDAGRILQYPSGTDDHGTDFAAQWRGYFGQERSHYDQRLDMLRIHCGDNCADNVAWKVRSMQMGTEEVGSQEGRLRRSNKRETVGGELQFPNGNLFQVEFSSSAAVSARWTIHDLHMRIMRTKKA